MDLHFDFENPRLAEYGISKTTSDDEILRILWDAMDVRELVQSISASGYFQHEPLIVAEEDGRHVVIEGNRRLAAVKFLIGDKVAKSISADIPALSVSAKRLLATLPVIISGRLESWRYLGFKHVNGPAKWSSYSKAQYIAEVHNHYGVSLIEIANQIGDRHQTVQRLYRGLMVLQQAEREKVFDREDRYQTRLSFSHLYTGLSYDGIASFINISEENQETQNPVPNDKLHELGELCKWLYGSKKEGVAPVVQSQNPDLRRLNSILESRDGTAALRSNIALPKSFEISRPASKVFEEALLAAKRELGTARAYLTTGFDGSDALLRDAAAVADLADDLYTEMERKQSPRRKKNRLAEV